MEAASLKDIRVKDVEVVQNEITMKFLKKRIDKDFGYNIAKRCNKRTHTYPRALFYRLVRDFTEHSLWEIADFIGVTHATVLNGINVTFQDATTYERRHSNYYKNLKAELEGMPTVENRLHDALITIQELQHVLDSYRKGELKLNNLKECCWS